MRFVRVLLTLVFAWSAWKGVDLMLRSSSMDQTLFREAGLAWVFWLTAPVLVLLNALTVVYLWRPIHHGYRCAQVAVLLDIAVTAIAGVIGLMNPEVVKRAYVASRTARGLPVSNEALELMASPAALLLTLGFPVVLGALWLFLLHRHEKARRLEQAAA